MRGRSAAEAWLAARPKAAASIIKEYFRIPVLPLSRWCQSGARPVYVLINALPWSPSSRKLANTGSKSARCLRAERKFALLVFQPRVALSECVANPSKLRRTCNCAPSSALGRWRSYRRIGVRLFAAWMRARKFVCRRVESCGCQSVLFSDCWGRPFRRVDPGKQPDRAEAAAGDANDRPASAVQTSAGSQRSTKCTEFCVGKSILQLCEVARELTTYAFQKENPGGVPSGFLRRA